MKRIAALVFASILCVSSAQARTWIVGPGGDFAAIQDAIDAASDGDVILVRPEVSDVGFYLNKAVMVRASSTPVIASQGFTIRDIPAGKRAGVSGMRIHFYGVTIEDCDGDIVIEDIDEWLLETGPFRIRDCANVSLEKIGARTFIENQATFQVSRSNVRMNQFTILGGDSLGTPAMRVTDSNITLSNGSAFGGEGAILCGKGGDGLIAEDSKVVILGDPANRIRGGRGGEEFPGLGLCGAGGDGIKNLRSDIVVSRVQVLGGVGDPDGAPSTGDPIAYDPRFPILEKTGPFLPGNIAGLTLEVVEAGTAILDMSIESGFFTLPQAVGPDLFVQPFGGWFYTVVWGQVAANGSLSLDFEIPDQDFLQGIPITFQGAVFSDLGQLFLANALTAVIGE